MLRRALLLILLLAGLLRVCGAQVLRRPVRPFTADDGLGGATITSLFKDARGFLWIGTPDELLLYDGRRFHPFRYRDSAHSGIPVPFRRAVMLSIDSQRLLIFHDGGANEYDFASGRLRPVPRPFPAATIPSGATLRPDLRHPGWYRLSASTLTARYHPPEQRWDDVRRTSFKLRSVLSLRSGTAELLENDTARNGRELIAIEPGTGRRVESWKTSFAIGAVAWMPGGALLLRSGHPASLWWMADDRQPVFLTSVRSFAFRIQAVTAGGGWYHIAAGQVLLRFNPATGQCEEMRDEAGAPLISKGVITELLADAGTLWVGTNASGLLRVALRGPRFRHLRSTESEYNFSHAIHPDLAGGRIYAGTYFGSVVVYDTPGKQIGVLAAKLQHAGRRSAYINAIEPLPDGGLFILNGASPYLYFPKRLRSISLATAMDNALRDAGFDPADNAGRKGIARIGPGEWWITEKHGLGRWRYVPAGRTTPPDLELRQYVRIPVPPEAIAFHAGSWWCATSGMLYRLKAGGGVDSFALPVPAFATSMREDAFGRLWIATESGIIVWRNGRVIRVLNSGNGLLNDHIYALQPDSAGWMWGSSNGGLFAVRLTDFSVRAFSAGDGLQGAEFNLGSTARDANGWLYFGGMNGINAFDPATALREEAPAAVTITRIAASDTIYFSYPGRGIPPHLRLTHDHASMQLEYTAAQSANTRPRQYEYRLNDDDSSWMPAGTEGGLQLQLAPGNYHIEIRRRGMQSGAAALRVTVAPPFYRTAWFLLLAIGLGAAVVATGVVASARIRYRRRLAAMESAQRVQDEKQRISRELHDELGARAAVIAHNAMQLAAIARKNPEMTPLAARISATTGDMLTALRETVWTLNQPSISLEGLWLRFKNFIVKLGASYEHIRFRVRQDRELPALPVHYSHALNLLRILQEAAMNAVKHSGAGMITVAIAVAGNRVTFTVEDDGCGFDVTAATDAGAGNGLYNMSYRSREAGLALAIRRNSPGGTIVELTWHDGGSGRLSS